LANSAVCCGGFMEAPRSNRPLLAALEPELGSVTTVQAPTQNPSAAIKAALANVS
jgi:hypothetical protein